jgi:hypothetical protein
LKYTMVIYTVLGLGLVIAFGVQQEWLDRKFPAPHEWSWISRKHYRVARSAQHPGSEEEEADWANIGGTYRDLLKRLEDPNIDGAGLVELNEGGIFVEGVGKTGYDISSKPEPWRRGYYEALMGTAMAAEELDGWVRDKTRNIAFPKNVVIGPSNPNPRPVPPRAPSAPKEEDCEPGFEPPEVYYMRILTTQGFTEKQRIDAALAYGAWLDYKSTPEAALEMFRWALDIASVDSPTSIDPVTGVLAANTNSPSTNILSATTALAVHHAVNSQLDEALPIFLSILRARRSLPATQTASTHSIPNPNDDENTIMQIIIRFLKSAITPAKYPPPPSDGTSPLERSAKERCEEAGIMTYIGEILYASKTSKTSKDDGLAWTREAVDIAEEELRGKAVENEAKETCKQCLKVGLGNWSLMVAKMAKAEKDAKASSGSGSWLGFGGEDKDVIGRWESEVQVVRERISRSKEILEPGEQAAIGYGLI